MELGNKKLGYNFDIDFGLVHEYLVISMYKYMIDNLIVSGWLICYMWNAVFFLRPAHQRDCQSATPTTKWGPTSSAGFVE